jgi:hypothetical protein
LETKIPHKSIVFYITIIGIIIGLCGFAIYPDNSNSAIITDVPVKYTKITQQDIIESKYTKITQDSIKTNNYIVKIINNLQPKIDKFVAEEIARAIVSCSYEYKLPIELIISLMNRESTFNPLAVSSADCCGLMQINYNVHKNELKSKLDINNYYECFYIENNIKAGCLILSTYLKKNNNNIKASLKNYVGGKHNSYIEDILVLFTELIIEKEKNA